MENLFSKILSGIPFLDDELKGIYCDKSTLFYGSDDGGRRIAMMQFLQCCFKVHEVTLLVTESSLDDLLLLSRSVGFDLTEAMNSKALTIVRFAADEDAKDGCLPLPESLEEFIDQAKAIGASRVVVDTILPWVQKLPVSAMPRQVERFFSLLEAVDFSTLLFLRKPVTKASEDLVKEVCGHCAIVVHFERTEEGNDCYSIRVEHYKGMATHVIPAESELKFIPSRGFALSAKKRPLAVPRSRLISHSPMPKGMTASGLKVAGNRGLEDLGLCALSEIGVRPASSGSPAE